MNKFAIFVFVAMLMACVFGDKDDIGVKVVMKQSTVDKIKDQFVPIALRTAKRVNIPDFSTTVKGPVFVGKVKFDIKNINIHTFQLRSSFIGFSDNNRMLVAFQGIDVGAKFGWHYRQSSIPHVHDSGKANCYTRNAWGYVFVSVGSDSNGHPTVKIVDSNFTIGDLHVSISGSCVSWAYNLIAGSLSGRISSALKKAVDNAMTGPVQEELSKYLANIPTQHSLGNYLAIDYSINHMELQRQNYNLIVGSRGEFFPKGSQPGKAPGKPVSMPDNLIRKDVQIFLSAFTLESLGYSIYNSGLSSRTIGKESVLSAAQKFFNTDFYAQYAPGIIQRFGSDVDVQLTLGLHQTPSVIFKQGRNPEIQAGVELTVRVKETSSQKFRDAFTVLIHCDIQGHAFVSNSKVFGVLDDATVVKATLIQTQVGSVDCSGIGDLFQFGLSIGQDFANEILAKGAPLPTMPGMKLLKPSIVYQDDYMLIASDVNFTSSILED